MRQNQTPRGRQTNHRRLRAQPQRKEDCKNYMARTRSCVFKHNGKALYSDSPPIHPRVMAFAFKVEIKHAAILHTVFEYLPNELYIRRAVTLQPLLKVRAELLRAVCAFGVV